MTYDHTSYRVIGNRGSGTSRVEWEFTPNSDAECTMVARIYGTAGRDPLVTCDAVVMPVPASVAAADYLKNDPEATVVRNEPKAYH